MSRASASPIVSSFAACACAFEVELDYVYRTFRRLGIAPPEAEDLTQDTFLVLWRRWNDFEPGRPLRPWLAGIAHKLALDHFRKHGRREVATEEIELTDDGPGPEAQLASTRARQLTLEALAMLPERYRTILVKHELDGISLREISEQTSMPFFTAAARLRRARLRFAKAVKQLQLRHGARWAMLSGPGLLGIERSAPPMPAAVRTRLRARLRPGAAAPRAIDPIGPAARVSRSLPVAAALVALLAAALVAGMVWQRRPPRAPSALPSAAAGANPDTPPRRTLAPPRWLSPPALIAVPAPVPAEAASLARGLVGQWRFEDGKGSTFARDSSGNGRPCLLHDLDPDTAWVEGAVGGGLNLGRRGWLECPMPDARAGVPFDLSVGIWMKRVAYNRPQAVLFTRQLPTNDEKHLFWFGMREDFLAVWSQGWSGWTTGALPQGEAWNHIAFVHAGRETRLFVNGELVRYKNNQLPRGEGVVRSPLTIGGMRYLADPLHIRHHFDGLVDEAIIYDRALSDVEVAVLARR